MTVLPALCGELAQAGDRIARRSLARRRQARIGGVLAVSAVTLSGVAAAAGLWNPQLGDAHRGQPTSSVSPPPADQLADFAVLRRAATSADQGAQSEYALKLLDPSFHGVRIAYVRLVGPSGGYVLIPVESYSPLDGTSETNALCLFARDPVDGGGLSCYTTQQILQGQAVDTLLTPAAGPITGTKHQSDGTHLVTANGSHVIVSNGPAMIAGGITSGLVPDGVARVRLTNSDGTVTVAVHDNLYEAAIPDGTSGGTRHPLGGPLTAEWLDAQGQVIAKNT
jgi:hypothetical protein